MTNRAFCIDIYHGNTVDGAHDEGFDKVKALGIAFLDHKLSQGLNEADPLAAFRIGRWMDGPPVEVVDVDGAHLSLDPRAGLYHFNGTGSSSAEANHFIALARPLWKPGIDLTLDWEALGASGGARPAAWADDWCSRVEDAFGVSVKVYGGNVPREQCRHAAPAIIERFRKRRLWFCQYGTFNPAEVPLPWKAAYVGVYQWQDDGDSLGPGVHKIPGIGRYCDNSTVVGSMTVAKMHAMWGGAPPVAA